MGNPNIRRPGKQCALTTCRQWFRNTGSNFVRQRYCSKRCAARDRPRSSRVAAGRKGGHKRAANFWGATRAQLEARVAGLPPFEAFLFARDLVKHRYESRIQSARRAGFSDGYTVGWDEAMAERRRSA